MTSLTINDRFIGRTFNVEVMRNTQTKPVELNTITCNKATINTLIASNASLKTSPSSSSNDTTLATTEFVHELLDTFTPSTGGDNARTGITFDETTNVSSASNLTTTGYVQIGGNLVVGGTVELPVNSVQRGAVVGLNTMLAQRAQDTEVVHLTGAETIQGIKTFANSPLVPTPTQSSNNTKVATTAYVDGAIANLINGAPSTLDTLAEIGVVLETNANNITAITSNMCNLSTNQTVNGTKTIADLHSTTKAIGDNSTAVATNEFVQLGLATKQPIGNYVTYSAPTQPVSVANINELINSVVFSSGTLNLDYATCKGVNYINAPTANFQLNISNVPVTPNAVYNLVLVMPSKFFATAININGVASTPRGANGFTNNVVLGSALFVMQNINICYFDSTTPTVFSGISSLY